MTDENLRSRTWSPRNLLLVGVLLAIAFLAGFLWQFMEARDARSERDALQVELTWEELGALLSTAVIQADNGGYENARQLMSEFFSRLQDNMEGAPSGAREEFSGMLQRRDAVITALSRADPDSERTLTQMYLRYRTLTGGSDPALPLPDAVPADTDGAPGTQG